MTKEELINAVQANVGGEKAFIKEVLETTLFCIKDSVKNGEEVTLRGFGTFKTKHRVARKARNIQKGTIVEVPAHDIVAFKPSKDFSVNKD